MNTLIQQLTEELLTQTERSQQLTAHTQRLEELVRDYQHFVSELSLWAIQATERDNLQQRASELVSKPFQEPMEGISGI